MRTYIIHHQDTLASVAFIQERRTCWGEKACCPAAASSKKELPKKECNPHEFRDNRDLGSS